MVLLKTPPPEFLSPQPSFRLLGTDGQYHASEELMGMNGLVIIFTCNHCPYAKALWNRSVRDYPTMASMGFGVVAINPNNHPDYPDDSYDHMVTLHNQLSVPFAYLLDADQQTAKDYQAVCTPDIFVLDASHRLVYRGAYDDNWKDDAAVTHSYLLNALDDLSNKHDINTIDFMPSMGCSIKWIKNDSLF